jgi:hypothetical protein
MNTNYIIMRLTGYNFNSFVDQFWTTLNQEIITFWHFNELILNSALNRV